MLSAVHRHESHLLAAECVLPISAHNTGICSRNTALSSSLNENLPIVDGLCMSMLIDDLLGALQRRDDFSTMRATRTGQDTLSLSSWHAFSHRLESIHRGSSLR